MEDILENKSAMVWAFDEVIDTDTDFEGNSYRNSIDEIKILINFLIEENHRDPNEQDLNITQSILTQFRKVVSCAYYDTESILQPLLDNQYCLVGWTGHAIFIFWEIQEDKSYDVGLINCGQGVEIHGYNHTICNGILIFKNIIKEKIENFISSYKLFYNFSNSDKKFEEDDRHTSFYFMLLNKLLDKETNTLTGRNDVVGTKVDIKNLIDNEKIESYEINSQIIGSCGFTNCINYVYYLYCKNKKSKHNELLYDNYLRWYHNCKEKLKNIIFNKIIQTNDMKYYNIYNYIQDTSTFKPNAMYETTIMNQSILKKNTSPPIATSIDNNISRDAINKRFKSEMSEKIGGYIEMIIDVDNILLPSLWETYENNNEQFIEILKENSSNETEMITCLFIFHSLCNYFDNGMKYIAPLLKLYELKHTYKHVFTEEKLAFIKHDILKNTNSWDEGKLSTLYYIFIYLLLIFDDTVSDKESYYYYTNDNDKKKENIKFYSFILSEIPIINNSYKKIIDLFIKDLNNHIELLPDCTNNRLINYMFKSNNRYGELLQYTHCITISLNKAYRDKMFSQLLFGVYTKEEIEYTIDNRLNNFISETILIDRNILNTTKERDMFEKLDIFEKIGYNCVEQDSRKSCTNVNTNFIVNSDKESIYKEQGIYVYEQPGFFNVSVQKYLFFYDKIKDILSRATENERNNMIVYYIVYFYLCEIVCRPIEDDIFAKYDERLYSYFIDINAIPKYKPLVYTYALRYKKVYDFNIKRIEINDLCLIQSNEKEKFKQSFYNYTCFNNYMKSVIDFYIIPYNIDNINRAYNIIIYRDDKNTDESIRIIKKLLEKYNNAYISLNYYFEEIEENYYLEEIEGGFYYMDVIKGTHKTNINNILYYYNSDLLYYVDGIQYIILENESSLLEKYKNFYNLMTYNDNCILLYKEIDKEEYYMLLGNYDIVFTMKNNDIFYKDYSVHFNDDIDIYNNYGIIKLFDGVQFIKLISFYNYHNISYKFDYSNEIKFVKKFSEEIYSPKYNSYEEDFFYKKYKYSIINYYDNNYILTDIYDVLSIMLNCFNYNSPYLLLKTIAQIKILINNFNINNTIQNYINTLIANRFSNIYSLPIIVLLNDKKILNKYNYIYFNKLYEKYNIPFDIGLYASTNELAYMKLSSVYIFDGKPLSPDNRIIAKYFYFNEKIDFRYSVEKRIDYNSYNRYNRYNRYRLIDDDKNPLEHIRHFPLEISFNSEMTNKLQTYNSLNIKYNYTKQYINKNVDDFTNLLKTFIPAFDTRSFTKNISKSNELYQYLIDPNKTYLYPIQEMIMGSGKSSIVTPYICLLLLNTFLSNRIYSNEIYIVMPDFLINQSFHLLMKNLFPLFNNTEILLYGHNSLYQDSVKIYLTSDTDYKKMFIDKIINTEKQYMIYDEVDMMSNPLTCELNIPLDEKILLNIDGLYDIARILYVKMFNNPIFWEGLPHIFNKIHNYMYSTTGNSEDDIKNSKNDIKFIEKVYTKFTAKISKKGSDMVNLISYIKKNILFFIFTKQFNFDYGIPSEYNNGISYKYKFKAIPYSGIDNPIMGSEFSDPILTYILTYFSYRLMNQKFRSIDKKYILKMFEKENEVNSNSDSKELLFNLFISKPHHINDYTLNREHYNNNLKNEFNIDEKYLAKIIKSILDLNKTYYSNCNNISFNDMMLYKNVKNFVCFTGTAYISTIKGLDPSPSFIKDNEIVRSDITDKDGIILFTDVEKAIEYVIYEPLRTKNIYMNRAYDIIDDIFNCLHLYDVLIDIGGIFIKYNIDSFIERYNTNEHRKKYIVYFDNGIKIQDITTKKFVNKDVINNNAFYYFSNKNITGVDAKDIMSKTAHGLVTVTNNTCLRDFSQGIFRMRNILDSQTIDIIFNNKFDEIISQKGGCNSFIFTSDNLNIRQNLFKMLKKEQTTIDEMKDKILLKQNIIALCKENTTNNIQIQYIDPSSSEFNEMGDKTIDIKNILNLIQHSSCSSNQIIQDMVEKYLTSQTMISPRQNQVLLSEENQMNVVSVDLSTEKSIEIQLNTQINFPYSPSALEQQGIVYSDFKYLNNYSNQILCLFNLVNNMNCVIVFNKTLMSIVLLDITQLHHFFTYNDYDISKQYTLISLFDSSQYGVQLEIEHIKTLVIISKQLIRNVISKLLIDENQSYWSQLEYRKSRYDVAIKISSITKDEEKFLMDNKEKIVKYSSLFTLKFIKIERMLLSTKTCTLIDETLKREQRERRVLAIVEEQRIKVREADARTELGGQLQVGGQTLYFFKYMKYKIKYHALRDTLTYSNESDLVTKSLTSNKNKFINLRKQIEQNNIYFK
jgi:hypothetical protein